MPCCGGRLRTLGWTTPDDTPDMAVAVLDKERKSRNFPEFLRPYSIGGDNPVLAYVTRKELTAEPMEIWKADAAALDAFLASARKDDYRAGTSAPTRGMGSWNLPRSPGRTPTSGNGRSTST